MEGEPESEWILHEVEAIVSEELWAECNAVLDGRKGTGKHLTKPAVHPFAGVAYCTCGGKMYVPSNTPKYVCKVCRNKIPIVDLEAVFHEQLKNFFFAPEELAAHLKEADAALKEKEELLAVLGKERSKLSGTTEKLHDLYQSGAIDKTGFGAKYHPLAERLAQLNEEIPKTQAEVDVMKIAHLSQEEIVAEARDLYTRWLTLPLEERRRIVEAITERITIGKDEVEIDLFYVPPQASAPSRATVSL